MSQLAYCIYIEELILHIYKKIIFEVTCADIQKWSLDNPLLSLLCCYYFFICISAFYDSNQQTSDANFSGVGMFPSSQLHSNSDYGSDTAYEISELGTPRHGMDNFSNPGMESFTSDHEITGTVEAAGKYGMSNNGTGMLVGDFILKGLERFSKRRVLPKTDNRVAEKDKVSEDTLRPADSHQDGMQLLPEVEDFNLAGHARRLSTESVGSDVSSVRHSEISSLGVVNLFDDGSNGILEGADASRSVDVLVKSDLLSSRDVVVALPSEQQQKMNRVLTTLQRRLATARTDMEDLIARLNQEAAVRQYLTTKVLQYSILCLFVILFCVFLGYKKYNMNILSA